MDGDKFHSQNQILTTDDMTRAENIANANGISNLRLMENAGAAVVKHITSGWTKCSTLVLCGTGNNGGDGFVVARLLRQAGWPVEVGLLGEKKKLVGAPKVMAAKWKGEIKTLSPELLEGMALLVDAVFGTGLNRPLIGNSLKIFQFIAARSIPVVAVDLPSGIDGNTGNILGFAVKCHSTVTFCRPKPAHYLLPGKSYVGELKIADIGISDTVLKNVKTNLYLNTPGGWGISYPTPSAAEHKYDRGHLLVVGGENMTGAARLAARAAMRSGSGLVSVASPPSAVPIYSLDLSVCLIFGIQKLHDFKSLLQERPMDSALIGPGCGVSLHVRDMVLFLLQQELPIVIDADALSVFAHEKDLLFSAIKRTNVVLTPHTGEFSHLFDIAGDKLKQARCAAQSSGAVILLKGSDTVISAPDGRIVINANAPPTLATAGSGDVLSGIIASLMGQGVPAFEAACMGAWVHGAAAEEFGLGLVASDIPKMIPTILSRLDTNRKKFETVI